jgi:integrase
LKWADIDLEKKTIRFRVTKTDRPYGVPIANVLHQVLAAYRDCEIVPPSEWAFPSNKRPGSHLIDVKNSAEGVAAKYHLRHSFRTTLTGLGVAGDQIRLLMGHALGGDVSSGYITAPLLIEALRPAANQLAVEYLRIIGVQAAALASFDADDGQ